MKIAATQRNQAFARQGINLASKRPQPLAIASTASWGAAGRNFGAHVRPWGVGI